VVEGRCFGVVRKPPAVTHIVHEHYAAVSEIGTIEAVGADQLLDLFKPVDPVHGSGFARAVHADDFDSDLICPPPLSVFRVAGAHLSTSL
jgi:hypothetical protein